MIRTATVTDVTDAGVWVVSSWLTAPTGPLAASGSPIVGDAVLVVRTDDGEMVAVSSRPAALPTSSVDNTVPRFDGTGGALQASGVTISDTNVVGGLGAPAAATDAATKGYVDDRMPCGSVTAFAGSSAPTGWLLCYGQTVSRTTYAALYAIIGTTYGGGDGSTTFNIPDLRGRVPAGLDNMGGTDAGRLDLANALGTAAGTQKHTLVVDEMPSHTHTQTPHNHTQNAHGHEVKTSDNNYDIGLFSNGGAGGISYYGRNSSTDKASAKSATATNQAATAVNQNTGGGGAHNNMQPTILLNWIIRT